MTRITHICLSDLHLGAPTSILTDTPDIGDGPVTADPLRNAFAAAFAATAEALAPATQPKPSIVLLGDIFDLSLGTPRSSIETFEQFLAALKAAQADDRFGSFVFLPGNHDHALWTASRFQHMVSASGEDRFAHTTRAFGPPDAQPRSMQIDQLLQRAGFAGSTTYYPNMGLISPDGTRVVVLHHGHFIESMYRMMSALLMSLEDEPTISWEAETLEALNASWIDFVWSTDGDNGPLGAEISRSYHQLMTSSASVRLDHKLAGILRQQLTSALPLPHTAMARQWTDAATKTLVDTTLGNYGQMERFSYQEVLGEDGRDGLRSYISRCVMGQMKAEGVLDKVEDLTFVFGHTHKPFESRVAVPGLQRPAAVYNTGGWALDTPMFGTRLGPAAVFVDDALNIASLRLANVPQADQETHHGAPPPVRVATADGTTSANPLAQALEAALADPALAQLWRAFSDEAARAYRLKQRFTLDWVGDLSAPTAAPTPPPAHSKRRSLV